MLPTPLSTRRLVLCAGVLLAGLSVIVPASSAQPSDLSVVTDTSRTQAFVNEQILLRRRVDASAAAFNIVGTDSAVNNADVLQLEQQSGLRQARQREITQWAIFARDPGPLKIGTHEFQATLPANGGTNPVVQASSDVLTVNILPAPIGPANSIWLPAANVTIEQQWTKPDPPRAGEPKKLLVTVTAAGQRAAAIPPLRVPATRGIRLYTSPASLRDQLDSSGITGVRVEHFTVVPASAGQFELGPFSLDWFNTTQRAWNATQSNRLTFTVKPSSSANSTKIAGGHWWMALVIPGVMTILWLIAWLQSRPATEAMRWRKIKRLLRSGTPIQIRQAILHWAQARWPSERLVRFEQIAAMPTAPEHRQVLGDLDIAAFGNPASAAQAIDKPRLREVLKMLRNHGLDIPAPSKSLARLYQA